MEGAQSELTGRERHKLISCPAPHVTQGQVHLLSTRAPMVTCLCWEGVNSACSHKDSLFLYICIPCLLRVPQDTLKERMSHAPAQRRAELKHCLQISLSHLLWEYKACGARGCWALECCCSWSSATPTALPGHHHASTPTKAGQPLGLQNNLPLKSTESQSATIFKTLTEKKAARILFCLQQKVNF